MMKRSSHSYVKRISIRNMMLSSYLILIILVTSTASIIFYISSVTSTVESTNKHAYSSLNELKNRLDSLASEITNLSYGISSDTDLIYNIKIFQTENEIDQLTTQQYINNIITNYWKLKPEVLNITVYISKMKYVGSVHNSIYPIETIEEEGWFKNLSGLDGIMLENHKLVSMANNPINCITAMTRINGLENNETGYVTVDIEENSIYTSILNTSKITNKSKVYLINNQKKIVSAEEKSSIGKIMNDKYLTSSLDKSAGGYLKENIDNKNYLVIFSDVGGMGWRVIEYIPTSELYTGIDKISDGVLVIIVISMLFAIPLSIYFSSYVTKPIIHLSSIMLKFTKSNIYEKLDTDFSNEIGILNSSYNIMLARINKLINDIEQANNFSKQSDIKLLQAQMNPHLLYNTLDCISWNALNNNQPQISNMITMISKFYKLNLNKGRSICTVIDEVNTAKYFVEIEKICFENSFEFIINMKKETEGLYIPKLIVQPLVENSIMHGFERKKLGGLIIINTFISEERLFIEIQDNGKGISVDDASVITTVDSKRGGYGIKNVNERIKHICGEGFGIEYTCTKSGYTCAKIVLPIIRDDGFFKNV